MKRITKFIFVTVALMGISLVDAKAQSTYSNYSGGQYPYSEYYDGVWNRTKAWSVGYVTSKLDNTAEKISSDYGFFTSIRKTYLLHKKPIGGFLKFGIDAVWTDINFIKYKDVTNPGRLELDGDRYLSIASQSIDVGMGVGPSVNFAPFFKMDNSSRDLRAALYFHFTPTFSILALNEDDTTNFYYGFSPVFNFGLNLQWKMLGIGLEGRWAKPHYSSKDDIFDIYEDAYANPKNSNSFKTASFRVSLQLCY